MIHNYQCPWCDTAHEVYFEPPEEGRNYGPPEQCYEAYDGIMQAHTYCPTCREKWVEDAIWEECLDSLKDKDDAAADKHEDEMKDRDWEGER